LNAQLARYICFTYLWPPEAYFGEIWYLMLALQVTGIQFWGHGDKFDIWSTWILKKQVVIQNVIHGVTYRWP